jgi:hypothetical protein
VTEASRTTVRRVVIAALLLLAGVLIWVSANYKAKPTSPSLTDAAVEALTPENDSPNVLRQSVVGIDLVPGWDADLRINGLDIPQDEERNVEGQSQILFTPGEGKVLKALPSGFVQVTAIIWRPIDGQTRERGSRTVTWSFRVA